MTIFSNYTKKTIFFLILVSIWGCGIYKPVDTRKVSVNANERTEKNIEEGKGFKVFDTEKKILESYKNIGPNFISLKSDPKISKNW